MKKEVPLEKTVLTLLLKEQGEKKERKQIERTLLFLYLKFFKDRLQKEKWSDRERGNRFSVNLKCYLETDINKALLGTGEKIMKKCNPNSEKTTDLSDRWRSNIPGKDYK